MDALLIDQTEGAGIKMSCVAFFGGSFNPPHVVHQMICNYLVETEEIDYVCLVPCAQHPFGKALAPFEDRRAMCELLVAPLNGRAVVSTIERDLASEANYTVQTLTEFVRRYPTVCWRLVVGTDVFAECQQWRQWEAIKKMAPPLVVGRQGYPGDEAGEVMFPNVSSTKIRHLIAQGESVRKWVTKAVADYIDRQSLYR